MQYYAEKTRVFALLLAINFLIGGFASYGNPAPSDAEIQSHISGNLDWQKKQISASMRVNAATAKIRPPSGRTQGEELLFAQYMEKIRPFILSIPVDSAAVLGDLVNKGELPLEMVDDLALSAQSVSPYYTEDFRAISSTYTIDLKDVSSRLLVHRTQKEMPKPLIPIATGVYSGIIIIATEDLPVHGTKTLAAIVPCLFPKIWDTDMNLIFDKTMTPPEDEQIRQGAAAQSSAIFHYTGSDKIFQKNPSGLDPELIKIVGDKPLRIIASGLFGIHPTDPIIARDDAMQILSSEANKDLLRHGRVAIIVRQEALNVPLSQSE
jgi:hypothetical protein